MNDYTRRKIVLDIQSVHDALSENTDSAVYRKQLKSAIDRLDEKWVGKLNPAGLEYIIANLKSVCKEFPQYCKKLESAIADLSRELAARKDDSV
ncbi:MAG: hypothetical protein HY203_06960 [Nitrospirae bacterium]|nr:hypothetical protein [Nitrospirota bacterium]